MQWTDELKKQYRALLIIAFSLYISAPIIYIFVVNMLSQTKEVTNPELTPLAYILLGIGLIQPLILPIIERAQIAAYQKNPSNPTQKINPIAGFPSANPEAVKPMALFTTISIIKGAVVEAIFVYGLVVYFIGGNPNHFYYFYPIGIFWTIIHFPRKSHYENFVRKVEQYG